MFENVCGSINWSVYYGFQCGEFSKLKIEIPYDSDVANTYRTQYATTEEIFSSFRVPQEWLLSKDKCFWGCGESATDAYYWWKNQANIMENILSNGCIRKRIKN